MKKINQFGMNLYQPYTVYPATSTNRLTFDLRSKEAYHGGHIEGTINIPYDKNFINQIGWYLNYNQEINLIGDYHLVSKATHNILYNLLDMIMCLDISYHKLKFKHNLFIVKT
ncbi:Zn-dependent hydrolase, glyoxylase [Mycobacteroides abscessus subsp. massiliense]|nr:Zn-dependent hydrolase, glyoxylase [Mycobacteroides abscessus subsp. massiliense]